MKMQEINSCILFLTIPFILIRNAVFSVGEGNRAATDKSKLFELVLHDLIVFVRVDFDIVRV
jgi:hypothetical protein